MKKVCGLNSRIFDKDDDGFISVEELRHIMQSLGEKMSEADLNEMIAEADDDEDGLINYEGWSLLGLSFAIYWRPIFR